MNREEAFLVMKNGGYITHPKLMEAGIGPLFLVGDTICGKYIQPIGVAWKTQIDSEIFNDGWVECDVNEKPVSATEAMVTIYKERCS